MATIRGVITEAAALQPDAQRPAREACTVHVLS